MHLTFTESSSSVVSWATQRCTRESLAARVTEHRVISSPHRLRYVRAAASKTAGTEWRSRIASISANRQDTTCRRGTRCSYSAPKMFLINQLEIKHLICQIISECIFIFKLRQTKPHFTIKI